VGEWVPFARDPRRAMELVRQALAERGEPEPVRAGYLAAIDDRFRHGESPGSLWVDRGETVGVACWERAGPLGVAIDLFHLERRVATPTAYEEVLGALEASAGPIAFLAGPLAFLAEGEESALLSAGGFARYGRSEMEWRPTAGSGTGGTAEPPITRPVERSDADALARLHLVAYHGRFDRYLFVEEADEVADARRHVRDILDGRWGEFLPHGSRIIADDGRAIGAVLSVRRPEGVLIADVMVDPERQGRGLGRAVLSSALRGLAERREPHVVLNVTEGNAPAIRLYASLGFVRSLGPSRDWYHTGRVPTGPSSS
jgi:ribosomal protein S18 acetylase RimI-like enzyme